MIRHIHIHNFAIIEDTEVDFSPGLNVITGETGSGKSVVITAISLALGARADSSLVRSGTSGALIELAGEDMAGNEIVTSREINAQGKNLCRLNGHLVTLTELAAACKSLADIHGQYDNLSLLDPANHLALLDSYSADTVLPVLREYRALYQVYSKKFARLSSLDAVRAENARQLDFYRFEEKEIADAHLKEGEEEELDARISLLSHAEKIAESAGKAYALLEGEHGAYSALGSALSALEQIASYVPAVASMTEEGYDLYYRLEDMIGAVRSVADDAVFSPEELDDAIARSHLIKKLEKKYGATVADVLAYQEELREIIASIENDAEDSAALRAEVRQAKEALLAKGGELSVLRAKEAKKLAAAIEKELIGLNFSGAALTIPLTTLERPSSEGLDAAEILIRTNPGEKMRPLARTASGGEISRIMLAIRNITAAYENVPTLIFDEIDQGISGKTAAIVGRKLTEIAKKRQTICITHLPQIAACGENAYRIYKETDDRRTYAHITHLNKKDRIDEIARLLGGETVTDTARENARELLTKASAM